MNEPSNYQQFDSSNDSEEELKSKTKIKQEFKALQELGRQLIELPAKQLALVPLSESMRELIVEAQSLKHGVLNRQIRLIGGRMLEEEVDTIRKSIEDIQLPDKKANEKFHEIEEWRDRLLKNDHALFEELVTRFSQFDRQYARQLVRNVQKEQKNSKPPKSSRLLFQYLKGLQAES